jgi:trimeric autotransporter adhesin
LLNDKIMDLFESLFGWIWKWLLGPFEDLRGFKELIFGNDGDEKLPFGIFTTKEIENIYMPGMNAFVALAVSTILIGIVISAMRISSAGINPSNRTYVIEFFKDLIIVALVLFNLSTLYHIILAVNYTIVNVFAAADKELIDLKEDLDASKGILGELIIQLALLGLAIWANFYYMMRKLCLLLLMIMGPLMISLYLIPQTKGITLGWIKELIGTVMVQSVHAALYWVVALMSTSSSGIEAVILYIIFIPVSESIRSLLGLGGQMTDRFTKTAAMFGGAALAGMYGSIKGAMDGKSMPEVLKGLYNGTKSKLQGQEDKTGEKGKSSGILSNAGTDIGSTSRAERMLKAGEVISKAGKAVFGTAGAIAGSPMGPTGAIVGSTIGATTGGVVGGVAGRTGMAIAEASGRRLAAGIKAGINKAKGIKNAESQADEKLANAIADDETTRWASANYENFKKDFQRRFPDAHQSSLNKAWNNELANKRSEFLDNARKMVGNIKKANGQYANAKDLINSTVDSITNDWANQNKEQFMQDYNAANPLPVNATKEDILKHNQNREKAWQDLVTNKRNNIRDIVSGKAAELGNYSILPNAISKDEFANRVGKEIGPIIGTNSSNAIQSVKGAIQSIPPSNREEANATELIDTTVTSLANQWASTNKTSFIKDYDAKNPLPANASDDDKKAYIQKREAAWQSAVANKKQEIQNVVTRASNSLTPSRPNPEHYYLNKEEFANTVGSELSSVIGKDSNESIMAIKNATSSVKGSSLYARKSVNTEYLAHQIATQKTNAGKEQFISQSIQSGKSNEEALQQWNQIEAPKRFNKNFAQAKESLPKHIPLDHMIIGNKGLKVAGATAGALTSFVTGASGIKEISQFVADTKIGQAAYGFASGLKEGANFDMSQGVITGTTEGLTSMIKSGTNTAVSHFKNHIPSNILEKQVGFKNTVAYTTGIIAGVSGYKAGASFAAGGTKNFSKDPGSLKFGFNPYNRLANQQISEVSEIAHMVQTIQGPNGEKTIPNGAIRMVTTSNETVLQVRDKAGLTHTVSRIASGNPELKNGKTIYQDLTIQNGQLTPSSNVYVEDSGGGRIQVNRSINVNPNQILANRNNPKKQRVVQEIQSYNQKVDSGQYYLKEAMTEMTNIHMVVENSRSFLVGSKNGKEYRISPYGPGDPRLTPEETVYRKYEIRNTNLIPTTTHMGSKDSEPIEYSNSTEPTDLLPKYPPNMRTIKRRQNEKFRNKSFTESLR